LLNIGRVSEAGIRL